MTEPQLDAQLQSEFDAALEPYLTRLAVLQKSTQEKDTDIILLSNAVENLIRQVDEYREKIKKLPKGKIMSEVR